MKIFTFTILSLLLCIILFSNTLAQTKPVTQSAPISFGNAQSFSVLAATTVTNTGHSQVSCNVGTFPGTSIVAFDLPVTIGGTIILGGKQSATPLADLAQMSANALYHQLYNYQSNSTIDLTTKSFVPTTTLEPGIYSFASSALLGDTLILNDHGDSNAVFIFKMGSTLITPTYSVVKMSSGSRGRNVFWLVGSSATIETYVHFVGHIIAITSISIKTGAINTGKLFALNAAVTMDFNQVDLGNKDCNGDELVVSDTDRDEAPDEMEDYPVDSLKAFNNYSSMEGSTLAFEDLWPYKGDYDMNDVVITNKYTVITNSSNVVVKVIANYSLKATGGFVTSGFGVQFPVPSGSIANLTGAILEPGQDKAVIILFTDDHAQLPTWNTFIGSPTTIPKDFTVTFDVINGPNLDNFGLEYNPFIFNYVGSSRRELHQVGKVPTTLADKSVFGTGDDNSNIAAGRYYVTKSGLPWVLNLPVPDFNYPAEGKDISNAYLHFKEWAQSGGTLFTDWYSNLAAGYRNTALIFTK